MIQYGRFAYYDHEKVGAKEDATRVLEEILAKEFPGRTAEWVSMPATSFVQASVSWKLWSDVDPIPLCSPVNP